MGTRRTFPRVIHAYVQAVVALLVPLAWSARDATVARRGPGEHHIHSRYRAARFPPADFRSAHRIPCTAYRRRNRAIADDGTARGCGCRAGARAGSGAHAGRLRLLRAPAPRDA